MGEDSSCRTVSIGKGVVETRSAQCQHQLVRSLLHRSKYTSKELFPEQGCPSCNAHVIQLRPQDHMCLLLRVFSTHVIVLTRTTLLVCVQQRLQL
jgi:hypothetical protein